MDKPAISVIIPLYNASEFLRGKYMLNSVLNQESTDCEILLVNDASTDDTHRVIADFKKRFANIKALNLERNAGEAGARNAGIDNAQGEYLLIFDQDDRVDPGLLSTLSETISKYNYPDLIAFPALVHHDRGASEIVDGNQRNKLFGQSYIRDTVLAANIRMSCKMNTILTPHWRVAYRKQMLDQYDVRYDAKKRKDEDQCFLNEALWCAKSLVFIDGPAYHWIRRDGSGTSMYSPMFENLLDNIHRYESRFGNYYDFNSPERIGYNVNKVLPDCYDFILCHERDKGVDKEREIMKILNNEEVRKWYEKAANLQGQPAKIKKALAERKPEKAYRIIDLGYTYKRIRRAGKKVLTPLIKK